MGMRGIARSVTLDDTEEVPGFDLQELRAA